MEANDLSNVSCSSTEDKFSEKLEQVKDMLMKMGDDSLESLVVIDSIQRLGIGYLFKDEIKIILGRHFLGPKDLHNLYKASLRFRLLRQHGYQVHADDFFTGFKGGDGEFKSKEDGVESETTKGVLALYEASHLSMEGEDILKEAAVFSSQHLNANLISLEDAVMVKHCLHNPQHKSLTCFTPPEKILQFLNVGDTWRNPLQELAFLESALLEPIHKHEILQVVKWWKGLGLSNEMKSSRDQPEKWHMWSMAVMKGPTWSEHRILLTKPISLVYAVDDIFDLYGTIDQLTLFTQAINRWELISGAEKLPNYMKICYRVIQDTTHEISRMVSQQYGWDPAHFLRKQWGNLFNAFLKEAEWFTSGKLVKTEEYLENGVISSGVPLVLSHLYFIMGNSLTQQTQTLLNHPRGLTYSVAKILRLLDDLGTAKDEEQEGYDGSYVECYMKQENVDSLEAAREHVMSMVSDTWENLNKHALSSNSPFSAAFREACLNAARMVPAMYNYDNNHRLPLLEQHVKSMFQDTNFTKSILG